MLYNPMPNGDSDFDTGFGADIKVVDLQSDAFTITAWLYKAHNAIGEKWDIFGDGNRGSFLVVDEEGRFFSSMLNQNNGRWNPQIDYDSIGTRWYMVGTHLVFPTQEVVAKMSSSTWMGSRNHHTLNNSRIITSSQVSSATAWEVLKVALVSRTCIKVF